MCDFCKETFYVKTIRNARPLLAPLTPEQELEDKLLELTGEVYLPLQNKYCPMCGEKRSDE